MRLTETVGKGTPFTFPIVVPPVVHKSGILHRELQPVWALAEERLKSADRVIIFGYSCPVTDWEAANLIGRSLTANDACRDIAIIDPAPKVLLRYVQLGALERVRYFKTCDSYLSSA